MPFSSKPSQRPPPTPLSQLPPAAPPPSAAAATAAYIQNAAAQRALGELHQASAAAALANAAADPLSAVNALDAAGASLRASLQRQSRKRALSASPYPDSLDLNTLIRYVHI